MELRVKYNGKVREQRAGWAEFESLTRADPAITVLDSGLGVMTLSVDAATDAEALSVLAEFKSNAGRLGIEELRLTSPDLTHGAIFMSPVADFVAA